MQSTSVPTAYNVNIDQPLASVGDRIIAYLIDTLIMAGYVIVLLGLLFNYIEENEETIVLFVVAMLPLFLYHLLCEIFLGGQSIGKKQKKIKVVKVDGSRPSIGAYLIRWILRPIDTFFYGLVAILTITLGGKGQRVGDLLAGTMVIKLDDYRPIYTNPNHEFFDDEYNPVFPNSQRLTDKDIMLIDKVLDYHKENYNKEPADLLAEKLKIKLNIASDMSTLEFLHTLKKDFNHYSTLWMN